jgi:hypothetical protein
MAQTASHLSASSLSVDQVAGAINGMIAERAAERLRGEPVQKNGANVDTVSAAKPREPGIYFGLPSAEYHADPSLGSSDIKRLLRSPSDYWWESHLNPDRPGDRDSPAKQKGRALHKLVLEGLEAFERSFACEPKPDAYPGALATLDDLKAKCRELSLPLSGGKAELAAKRTRGAASSSPIRPGYGSPSIRRTDPARWCVSAPVVIVALAQRWDRRSRIASRLPRPTPPSAPS